MTTENSDDNKSFNNNTSPLFLVKIVLELFQRLLNDESINYLVRHAVVVEFKVSIILFLIVKQESLTLWLDLNLSNRQRTTRVMMTS